MKKILLTIVLSAVATMSFASEGWLTDFAEAQKLSKEKNLPIVIDFTGSDWCGWCIKLDKEVFKKKEFKAWAKKNVILFMADFPSRKKISSKEKRQNSKLAKKYKVRGYPTILVIDAEGTVLGKTGYQAGGPKKYIKHLEKFIK